MLDNHPNFTYFARIKEFRESNPYFEEKNKKLNIFKENCYNTAVTSFFRARATKKTQQRRFLQALTLCSSHGESLIMKYCQTVPA